MRTRARPCNPLLLAAHCADSRCAPPPGRRFGRARPRVTNPRVVTLADGAQTGGRPPPPSLPFPRCADRRPVWAVGPNRPPRPIHPQALRTGAPRVLPRARLPVSYRGHRWGRWLAAGQPRSPPPVACPPARRSPPPCVLVMQCHPVEPDGRGSSHTVSRAKLVPLGACPRAVARSCILGIRGMRRAHRFGSSSLD